MSLCAFALLLVILRPANADQYVNGYYRSNGTYVEGYYRSSPDSSPYNNFSYPGNYNPYTGNTAGGNVDTYLNNYDTKDSSSIPNPFVDYGSSSSLKPGDPYACSYPVDSGCQTESDYQRVYSQTQSLNSGLSLDVASQPSVLLCRSQITSHQTAINAYNSCINAWKNNATTNLNNINASSSNGLNNLCQRSFGSYSSYDAQNSQCSCASGYRLYDGQCQSNFYTCVMTMGANSHYSSTGCQCDDGYYMDTSTYKCVAQMQADTSVNEYTGLDDIFKSNTGSTASTKTSVYDTWKRSRETSVAASTVTSAALVGTSPTSTTIVTSVATSTAEAHPVLSSIMRLFRSMMFWR